MYGGQDTARADHVLWFFGREFLRLHYRMRLAANEAGFNGPRISARKSPRRPQAAPASFQRSRALQDRRRPARLQHLDKVSPGLSAMLATVRRVLLSPLGRVESRLASASHSKRIQYRSLNANLAEPPTRSKCWIAMLYWPASPDHIHSAEHAVSPHVTALPAASSTV